MIIKSMSRKEPSFGQLIDYMSDIDKSQTKYNVYQNLFARQNRAMEAEFLANAKLMRKRKNGNYLYHEILSITVAEQLSLDEQKARLRDIAYEYAKRRAPSNLIFGTLHDDHGDDHLHYHLLISANALGEAKKTRLSKAEFSKFKKELEQMVLTQYPELEQSVVINQEAGEKLSNKGAEQKRRTGKTPQRDAVKTKLVDIFSRCADKEAFFTALDDAGLSFYVRGKTIGVKDLSTGRNHRLKTLGMLEAFDDLSQRIEQQESASDESTKTQEPDEHSQTAQPEPTPEPQEQATAAEQEQARRKAEMDALRDEQAQQDQEYDDDDYGFSP